LVTVAVKTPETEAVVTLVIFAFDQIYVHGPGPVLLAVRVLVVPGQILAGTLMMLTVGLPMVIVELRVTEQPLVPEIIHE
jgi:hypothetical protein